jgi:hypothetical protein
MKRLFKFFTVAAIIAAGFTGCSNETAIDPGEGPGGGGVVVEDGEATYATFKFSVSDAPQTRSVDPATGEVAIPVVTEYRLFVFRADNTLEIDTFASNSDNLTIPLISGVKKIFVLVNGGTDAANLSTPAKGSGLTTYADFNAVYDLATGTPPTDFTSHTLLYGGSGSKFIYSSDVKTATQTLAPGVSAADSQNSTNSNYKAIEVDRLVAKVAVTKTVPSQPEGVTPIAGVIITRDSTGRIVPSSVKYHLWNINKGVYPFQNYDASNVLVTPYGNMSAPFANYYLRNQGDGGSNTAIDIATRGSNPPLNADYRFVTENVPSNFDGGNVTYAEVEAVFLPTVGNYISTTIGYNESSLTFMPVAATADLGTTASDATDMYQFTGEGYLGFPVGTLIAGANALALAKKVVYHILNPTVPPKTLLTDGAYVAITPTQVETYFAKYVGGKAYYRLNFGEQSGGAGTDINFGVKRNHYYDANISGFATLGAKEPADILDEGTTLQGRTSLTVHIIIRDWQGKEITIDI